jgi:hypothetical protein
VFGIVNLLCAESLIRQEGLPPLAAADASCCDSPRDFMPARQSLGHLLTILEGGEQVPSWAEVLDDGTTGGEEPLANRFIRHDDPTSGQELFHVTIAQTEAVVEPDTMADDLNGKMMLLVMVGEGWCIYETKIAHQTAAVQAR